MSASSDFDAAAMRERYLGEAAKQLYVFQRTPSSVDVRGNSVTDPAWASSLEPGWHKYRMENFNSLISGVPQEEDLVDDGWTDLIGKMVRRCGRQGAGGPLRWRLDPVFQSIGRMAKRRGV